MMDVTRRFSSRAAYYHDSRPDYPPTILPYLEQQISLTPGVTIADIGSGTGLLTHLTFRPLRMMEFFDLVNISERYMELVNPSPPE